MVWVVRPRKKWSQRFYRWRYTRPRVVWVQCGGSTMPWWIHNIDFIALLQQECSPARTTVRCRNPIEPLASTDVDEHNRELLSYLLWFLIFDIHLRPINNRMTFTCRVVQPDPEVPLVCEGYST